MRLKLADLLVKPMQRVTKYALLLKAILSQTSNEEERLSIEVMVRFFKYSNGHDMIYSFLSTLMGLIFARINFREFWSNSRN